jgi:hypothetical protein
VKNVVVTGATGPEQTTMRLEVEVELDGMSDVRVDDGPGNTVPRAVGLVRVRWEKADVVTLADDNDRDLRVYIQGLAGR